MLGKPPRHCEGISAKLTDLRYPCPVASLYLLVSLYYTNALCGSRRSQAGWAYSGVNPTTCITQHFITVSLGGDYGIPIPKERQNRAGCSPEFQQVRGQHLNRAPRRHRQYQQAWHSRHRRHTRHWTFGLTSLQSDAHERAAEKPRDLSGRVDRRLLD